MFVFVFDEQVNLL